MIKNNKNIKNNYNLYNVNILNNEDDLIVLFKWDDSDLSEHTVDFCPIIEDLHMLLNKNQKSSKFVYNKNILKITHIQNMGQLRYYLMYDKKSAKFILSIRGTDSTKSIVSNCGINVQLVINAVRHHYKQKCSESEIENIQLQQQIYLYLTNIISNFIKDSSLVSDIFNKHFNYAKSRDLYKSIDAYIFKSNFNKQN